MTVAPQWIQSAVGLTVSYFCLQATFSSKGVLQKEIQQQSLGRVILAWEKFLLWLLTSSHLLPQIVTL